MTILDGKAVAAGILTTMQRDIAHASGEKPNLAIILIGENEVSKRYVERKRERAAEVGIETQLLHFPPDTTQGEVLKNIEATNQNPAVHGLIVQLPLPPHIDPRAIMEAIHPDKDVDGFHPINLGKMMIGSTSGRTGLTCATPTGVLRLLDHYDISVEGKRAVVIGRSNIVGKPLAILLINRGATVTSCNSKTSNLPSITAQADILISATGRARSITGDMVKDGAVVVDVGQVVFGDELLGDVDFASVSKKASFITPVPGGVGPMTIAILLENTWRTWKENGKLKISARGGSVFS
jgi:methylenetetrahydrofolate dehydrogenase (NADP+)/methenyltetrahydrofolate cyclohydrolase